MRDGLATVADSAEYVGAGEGASCACGEADGCAVGRGECDFEGWALASLSEGAYDEFVCAWDECQVARGVFSPIDLEVLVA